MSENKRICKYCKASMGKNAGDVCPNCTSKLPLVRELIAIGNKIKRSVKK